MYLLRRVFGTDGRNGQNGENGGMERNKLLRRFGKRGKGKGQFNMPSGVAVTKSGDIVVADTENHRVQIFTSEGQLKCKFGLQGALPHQINYPMCVALTTDENVVVSDSVNAVVKIFNLNGEYITQYGTNGVFEFPYGLAVSPENFLVVTDISKHSVTVLYPSGGVSHAFGSYGEGTRHFDHPYFVAVNRNKQIIVTDSGNGCVKLFHFEGRLLRCFSWQDFRLLEGQIINLYGLCSDPDGNTILVCNSTVYILARNGRLWEILTPLDGLTSPKCIAYSPLGQLVLTQADYSGRHEVCLFKYNKEDYESLNALLFYAISI